MAGGKEKKGVGKHWVDGFIRRNPSIKTKIGKPLSAVCARYTTKGAIVNFFNLYERILKDKGIKTANIANMDECGV